MTSHTMAIPERLLVASDSFGTLAAASVAAAIGRGLQAGGWPAPDSLPLPSSEERPDGVRRRLDAAGFDARMRGARAVILAVERLSERSLAGSSAFEIATRARQGGVPAYAVTGENRLDLFDLRILDLQAILEAGGARALVAAGRQLAGLV